MPSWIYRWGVKNASVAMAESQAGVVIGRALGQTEVQVEDTRVQGHDQTSTLFVVMPVVLRLVLTALPPSGSGNGSLNRVTVTGQSLETVSSDGTWHLVRGRLYVVQVLAYSRESENRPIILTKENDLRMRFDNPPTWEARPVPEDVAASEGWLNSTLIHATAQGRGTLLASLATGVMNQDPKSQEWRVDPEKVITGEQEVVVCAPVKIKVSSAKYEERLLNLPWFPGHSQDFQLLAEGGCGNASSDFLWVSFSREVVEAGQAGLISAVGPGKAIVRATALRDPLNFDEISVEVSYPASLAMLPGLQVEAQVGSVVVAGVMLRDSSSRPYTTCSTFHSLIKWSISPAMQSALVLMHGPNTSALTWTQSPAGTSEAALDLPDPETLRAALATLPEGACSSAALWAARPGRVTLTAALDAAPYLKELPSFPTRPNLSRLEASSAMSAYAPLLVMQLGDGSGYGGYRLGLSGPSPETGAPEGPGSAHEQALVLEKLLLAPGSSIKVALRGGPSRWHSGVEFVDSCEAVPGDGGDTSQPLHVAWEHLAEEAGRIYVVSCTGLGTFVLNFFRGNIFGAPDHPKRSVANASLVVVCSVPSSIILLVDELYNSHVAIRECAQQERDSDRTRMMPITVVNGRRIRAAAVALDAGNRPFANASSLGLSWRMVEGGEYATWGELAADEDEREARQPGPWERALVLSEKPGKCTIRATVKRLEPDVGLDRPNRDLVATLLLDNKATLSDAAVLQLVSALRLEPPFQLLFNHPQAKAVFAVLGGTSDIQPSINDTRVAEIVVPTLVHAPKLSRLSVRARAIGAAAVTIQDMGVSTPTSASAAVVVADVAWIRLLLPEVAMLLLGSNLTVLVEAGDSAGHLFDPSQFPFMRLQVHLQDEVLQLQHVGAAPLPNGGLYPPNSFVVRGINVGLTTALHVSMKLRSDKSVVSEAAKVSVYAPLSLEPSKLKLAPRAKYMVLVHGGPRRLSVVFASSNSSVASVNEATGLITAKAPGDMTVFARAQGHGGETLSEASMEVEVVIPGPEDMELFVRSGRLGIEQEMDVMVVGRETRFDALCFAAACTDYQWEVSDNQVFSLTSPSPLLESCEADDVARSLAEAGSPASGAWVTADFDPGFQTRVIGRSSGRSTITVSFSCNFFAGANAPPHIYSARATVAVIPQPPLALGLPATWLLPLHYRTSKLLPYWSSPGGLPAVAEGAPAIVYSMMQDMSEDGGLIASIERGRIQTHGKADVACIHARDKSHSLSAIAACVRTAEIAQVTVGDSEFPFHAAHVSLGASHSFRIAFRDDLGFPFTELTEGAVSPLVESNRPDVVSATIIPPRDGTANFTLLIQALRQGTAMVRVFTSAGQDVVSIAAVRVDAHVVPSLPILHVGASVNFTVHAPGLGRPEGRWSSTNDSVVRIDVATGEARAVGEGRTAVSFVGQRLTTQTIVSVVRVGTITVEPPSVEAPLTNVGGAASYPFRARFRDRLGNEMGTPAYDSQHQIAFKCLVEPPALGKAIPRTGPGPGHFFCDFFPQSPEELADIDELAGTVKMAVVAVVPGNIPVQGRGEAVFVGGFSIVDTPRTLYLTSSNRTLHFNIVGNTGDVTVSWSRKDVMAVKRKGGLLRDPGSAVARAVFEVKLFEDVAFSDKIVLELPRIGQVAELRVLRKRVLWPVEWNSPLAVTIVSAVSAIVGLVGALCLCCVARNWDQGQGGPAGPPLGAASTPGPERRGLGTPIAQIQTTPRNAQTPASARNLGTPSPFAQHVQNTRERFPQGY